MKFYPEGGFYIPLQDKTSQDRNLFPVYFSNAIIYFNLCNVFFTLFWGDIKSPPMELCPEREYKILLRDTTQKFNNPTTHPSNNL